jgi:hypothetical protein
MRDLATVLRVLGTCPAYVTDYGQGHGSVAVGDCNSHLTLVTVPTSH